MDKPVLDFYTLPFIGKKEDAPLLSLREHCAALEERVFRILEALPEEERMVIAAYIDMRNDLEIETLNAFLR